MNSSGALGEAYAAQALERAGYRILARNYRVRGGEIDLIAVCGDILAFVEVKTRGSRAQGRPAEAVTPRKQRRLILTAQHFLLEYPGPWQPRFDIVEVETGGDGRVRSCYHLKGAFELNETNRPD